ncbi:MAG: hypothetical protein Q8Q09_11805 [Deltaproteobacteria bacterium]|nr:hypothetical protein [Deltaproteobacteria bacterium]
MSNAEKIEWRTIQEPRFFAGEANIYSRSVMVIESRVFVAIAHALFELEQDSGKLVQRFAGTAGDSGHHWVHVGQSSVVLHATGLVLERFDTATGSTESVPLPPLETPSPWILSIQSCAGFARAAVAHFVGVSWVFSLDHGWQHALDDNERLASGTLAIGLVATPDLSRLLVLFRDRAELWADLATSSLTSVVSQRLGILAATCSREGASFGILWRDGWLRWFSVRDGTLLSEQRLGFETAIEGAVFVDQASRIVAWSAWRHLYIVPLEGLSTSHTLRLESPPLYAVEDPAKSLWLHASDGTLARLDLETGDVAGLPYSPRITTLAFEPDGQHLIIARCAPVVDRLNCASGEVKTTRELRLGFHGLYITANATRVIHRDSCVLDPVSGEVVLEGTDEARWHRGDADLRVRPIAGGVYLEPLGQAVLIDGFASKIAGQSFVACFSRSGEWVGVQLGAHVALIHVASGKCRAQAKVSSAFGLVVDDGGALALLSYQRVTLLRADAKPSSLPLHESSGRCVAFAGGTRFVIVAKFDGTLMILDSENPRRFVSHDFTPGGVHALAVSPDEALLAIATGLNEVKLCALNALLASLPAETVTPAKKPTKARAKS